MTADQEKIRRLEARVAELERQSKCACCEPVFREAKVCLVEARTDYSGHSFERRAVVRLRSEWGDLEIPADDVVYRKVMHCCSRLGVAGTLRLELK